MWRDAVYILARTASRYQRDYILPLWFFLSSFFFFDAYKSQRSLNRSQPNLDTYSLMTAGWNIWSELPGHLVIYPHGLGTKKRFFGTDFELWPNRSLQRNILSIIGKKLVNLQGLPYMPPNLLNFCLETAESGWRVFAQPLNFRIGRHCQPYRMYVT